MCRSNSFKKCQDRGCRTVVNSPSPSTCLDHVDNCDPRVGDVINSRYVVKEFLGQGTFGKVFCAWDVQCEQFVALKIMKREDDPCEYRILLKLKQEDSNDEKHIVRLLDDFVWNKRTVLVFELLGPNLIIFEEKAALAICESLSNVLQRNLQHSRRSCGLPLQLIQRIAEQIFVALEFLASPAVKLVHRDIKPDNILVSDEDTMGVKLADFGSACGVGSEMTTEAGVQSLCYRPPEIVLGIPYDSCSDIWSLGCLLAELHTGELLFRSWSEEEHLRSVVELVGMPTPSLLGRARNARRFFSLERTTWCLQGPPVVPRSRDMLSILGGAAGGPDGIFASVPGHDPESYRLFSDLLLRCLAVDPRDRITASQALHHPFFALPRRSKPVPVQSVPPAHLTAHAALNASPCA